MRKLLKYMKEYRGRCALAPIFKMLEAAAELFVPLVMADIIDNGNVAYIHGRDRLQGAKVRALDLRAGAAMVIAGLAATGITEIEDIKYIERGYEKIIEKLTAVGADIRRVTVKEDVDESNLN